MTGPIQHIVVFKYKDSVSDDLKLDIAKRFLALKDQCRSDQNQEEYITSVSGGKNQSPNLSFGKGFEHAFIVTFADFAARDYYLTKDPAHLDFVEFVKPSLSDIFEFDYQGSSF